MANDPENGEPSASSASSKKRKWPNNTVRHGSKKHGDKRDKGRDLGRKEYRRENLDKRERHSVEPEKRRKLNPPDGKASALPKPFSEEEIAAEERRPKHKVAVMIGYAGTGYKGMQITWSEKTIEGDLFHAFVKAGAISKANANDPKKSSLVRCARTDKGVHAAGNVISLKLIVEDPEVVQKINTHLPAQIRVWGIERTIGSFSCYQACDSRWYEYLIPTHCLLPPHPSSFLAKELEKAADEVNDRKGYEERQAEVSEFWQSVEENDIRPILDSLDGEIRSQVMEALYRSEQSCAADAENIGVKSISDSNHSKEKVSEVEETKTEPGHIAILQGQEGPSSKEDILASTTNSEHAKLSAPEPKSTAAPLETTQDPTTTSDSVENTKSATEPPDSTKAPLNPILDSAIKRLRHAYLTAKRRYRISASRIARLQSALSTYEGTHNFYNYTIQKSGRDPSAKRHIRSFQVNPTPILKRISNSAEDADDAEAEETEWLSLKVHGQSFMMHQIRKMVGMASLAVRCGADAAPLLRQSYDADTRLSIPKAPGLGLLLERPVFDSYNRKVDEKFKERASIGFERYVAEMEAFKEREIYGRVFGEEQRDGVFHSFFSHVDNYREPYFLYLTSKGVDATKDAKYGSAEKDGGRDEVAEAVESEDEIEAHGAEGEGREG